MSPVSYLAQAPLVLSSLTPSTAWLAAASPSTYFVAVAVCAALTTIVMATYRNAQATGSVGQLLHETEVASVRAGRTGTRS